MKILILLISLLVSTSLSAMVDVNCIMIHESSQTEVIKKEVSLEASDTLKQLYKFEKVMVGIKPHAVINIDGNESISSFKVILKSNDGFTASAIGEEVFNHDSSVSVSLSNKQWSLLTECYQIQ
ncbi:hypothetical protein [Photobacterium profundum]|uniref:Uncharacterized protein n=1 Tax=Photobacterium profundum (strain SS9) TaxID=298386 RepID=Q6LS07_PHOPR|nr:hypothetical protein [Photobacterium profundum]CAG19919.1 hypothetical protein PBPRA1508 [Photobacterium profundum SS9]